MAVEVLIRYQDSDVPDSAGKWYGGMIIAAQETPTNWGAKEPNPPATIMVRLNNCTLADVQPYLTTLEEDLGETDPETGQPVLTFRGRRGKKMTFTNIPPPLRNQLEAGTVLEFDWTIIEPWLENHVPV